MRQTQTVFGQNTSKRGGEWLTISNGTKARGGATDTEGLLAGSDRLSERSQAEREEQTSPSCTSVHRLEFWSAVWSSVVLAFMFGLLILSPRIRNVELPIWWSVTQLVVDSSTTNTSIGTYHDAWAALCPAHNIHPVNATQTFPGEGDTAETGVAVRVFAGNEQWKVGFYPLYALIWIFAVSVVFQGARAAPMDGAFASVAAFFDYEITAAVEFSRWLEYALTSPLQLWLVLASFFVGDFATLLYAALGQAGLVLLGGLLEHYVGRAAKKRLKHEPGSDAAQRARAKAAACEHCALVLLVLTWLLHILLWLPVLMGFYRVDTHFSECGADAAAVKRWGEVRGIVYFILYSQLITFSLFGLRLTLTAFENVQTRAALFAARVRDARWYALLSVAAKSALDAGFVLLLFRLSAGDASEAD